MGFYAETPIPGAVAGVKDTGAPRQEDCTMRIESLGAAHPLVAAPQHSRDTFITNHRGQPNALFLIVLIS